MKKLVCDLESCAPIGKSDHIAIGFSSQIKINLKPTHIVIRPDLWRADYEPIKKYLLLFYQKLYSSTPEELQFIKAMDESAVI